MRSELQPLRIPAGWRVTFNDFFQTEPNYDEPDFEGSWWDFKEDMFQAELGDVCLDLGWYPEFKKNGNFRLVVVRSHDWTSPEITFRTTSKTEIVSKMEELLQAYQRQTKPKPFV